MKSLVFLAGPITGLTYANAVSWREYVCDRLPDSLIGFSALRGKPHLAECNAIESTYDWHPLTTAQGITTRDYNDVSRCELLLVNFLGATEVSCGTLIEIGWAYSLRKPILMVIELTGNPHDCFMVRESAAFAVDNLDEAIDLAPDIILPRG